MGVKLIDSNQSTNKKQMPVIFLGHGSPMNAIRTNKYTENIKELANKFDKPKAILMISAHWVTQGVYVTAMENPKTIHDFYGFPQELFDVQYPAPGQPALAQQIQQTLSQPPIALDESQWGLDHGAWSVLVHMYPLADVPVIQLSLDLDKPPQFHFELGQKLSDLRQQGVLIVGSGNVVHNLRKVQWDEKAPAFPWALEFEQWVKDKIQKRDFEQILSAEGSSEIAKQSIPTPEHYYPLFYILGAAGADDPITFENEGIQNGSISMLSLCIG